MKTNLIKKFKWYIVGFIMIVIMLSVGLSFCTWDNLSINNALSMGRTGNYDAKYMLGTQPGDDKGTIGVVDVGDIVTFGRYWQATDSTGAEGLEPQRWIVVNIDDKNVATLLTEKVVVFGNFWGSNEVPHTHYQNYYQSTLRAWLNSGRDSVTIKDNGWELGTVGTENLRDDTLVNNIGSAFSGTAEKQANRGFLDVAFSDAERTIIVPKRISGMNGYAQNTSAGGIGEYSIRNNANVKNISDLVWVPSYKEIYGDIKYYKNNVLDGTPSEPFQYFEKADKTVGEDYNTILAAMAEATDYAWNSFNTIASYYNNGVGSRDGAQSATWWWLRSPYPEDHIRSMVVGTGGQGGTARTFVSYGGVRPAVCVQL